MSMKGGDGFRWKIVSTVSTVKLPLRREPFEAEGAEVILDEVVEPCREEDILRVGKDADILISWDAPYSAEVIRGLERCRFIMIAKLGVENVDLDAATEKGILVANLGPYCKEEVAEHTMALLLCLARRIPQLHQKVLQGYWGAPFMQEEMRKVWQGIHRIKGQVLGLVGFGAIGRAVAEKASGFGFRILVYDPYVPEEVIKGYGAEKVDLDRLLEESDFVSVHCALTPENRNLFGLEQFRKMKPTAYFINVARGELVDSEALYVALKEGIIAGAGLDVVGEQMKPLPLDHPLYWLPNVVVTGHSAFFSEEAKASMPRIATEEVLRVMKGQWPVNLINKGVKERYEERFGPMA